MGDIKLPIHEAWIRFTKDVEESSVDNLFKLLDYLKNENCKKINLLISSQGGSDFYGETLYNYIKSLNFKIDTYNIGFVESIAILLFCLGENRYTCKHSRFMIHEAFAYVGGTIGGRYNSSMLLEAVNGLNHTNNLMYEAISINTNMSIEEIKDIMKQDTYLTPKNALQCGLVHEIKTPIIPIGSKLFSVGKILWNDDNKLIQYTKKGESILY